MENTGNKHENYEILNLLGYGLSKFSDDFVKEFGYKTKNAFYRYFVEIGLVEKGSVVKSRMDLFDPFFQNNERKGWTSKGDTYIHRKILIDSLFGSEDVKGYANIVKMYLKEKYAVKEVFAEAMPILKSKFRKLQETGLEAELYFMNNFHTIEKFNSGILSDARLYGDGYDFQIDVNGSFFLAEVKGIREKKGVFRLTEKEYHKALEFKNDYVVTIVLNLNETPTLLPIENPANNLNFKRKVIPSEEVVEYHLEKEIC